MPASLETARRSRRLLGARPPSSRSVVVAAWRKCSARTVSCMTRRTSRLWSHVSRCCGPKCRRETAVRPRPAEPAFWNQARRGPTELGPVVPPAYPLVCGVEGAAARRSAAARPARSAYQVPCVPCGPPPGGRYSAVAGASRSRGGADATAEPGRERCSWTRRRRPGGQAGEASGGDGSPGREAIGQGLRCVATQPATPGTGLERPRCTGQGPYRQSKA